MTGTPKCVLMIAFHFPPCAASSGQQRTLSFSKQLRSFGWSPVLLTPHPRVYERVSDDQLDDIPPDLPVKRAFALDISRHLAINGRYPGWLALPDKWISWFIGAIPTGLAMVRRYRPDVLWSTYPITTAHLIGYVLHRLTGIPWIADFRDPMVEFDLVTKKAFPLDPTIRRVRLWAEGLTMRHCSRAVLVTPGARRIYAERYPEFPEENLLLISNGYDEESFSAAAARPAPLRTDNRVVLLHSGVLYPTPDRHPGAFFSALSSLHKSGKIADSELKVVLRASSYETGYNALIREQGLQDMVFLEPAVPYRDALAEMLHVDGLLIFQGHDSNPAVPAKLYEYLRARRPIFAMVDPDGDTAGALRAAGLGKIVPMDSSEEIATALLDYIGEIRAGTALVATQEEVMRHSRRFKAQELADVLNTLYIRA